MMKNEKIIRKVKRLLALARENKSDEEGQSAFILAQRLMLENNIAESEVSDDEAAIDIITENEVTIHKKLFWWERNLADIIADNFRVKLFFNEKKIGATNKDAIVFYGIEKDLELAKEMFYLAYEAIVFHSKHYIACYYKQRNEKRERYLTESLKTSYMRGFLGGMKKKFEEQISVLRDEFEVLVLTPEKVETGFEEYTANFSVFDMKVPSVLEPTAYSDGYEKGNSIDFTKSTISESV
ncbi:DUF2786 domain-containing protein [Listeria innocua]|nr:DUF2786 domain-containing protein [Listeria innocua]